MTPWEISEQLTALFKIHIFTFPYCRFWWRWQFLRWLRRTTPIWIWSKHLSWGRSHLSLDSSGIKSFFESTTCYCCHFMYLCVFILCCWTSRFAVAFLYYGISFKISGFGVNIYLTHFIYGAIEVPAKVFAFFILDWIGRRNGQAWFLIITGSLIGINTFIPLG